ncbi:MAG TPA: TIGR00730 family Rossman fold protein [Capsulimonadaceae bacterium]|jgi:hypothetical protein
MRSICVFCGSKEGDRGVYREAAAILGSEIARREMKLIYGGGNIGLMGVVADAVLAEYGEVIGVIPQALLEKEVGHDGLTALHVVASMHERKARMADMSDAFIAMPGGFGTFEEFCEIVTWAQLGMHRKPCGILNVDGYYDPLLEMFDKGVRTGFIKHKHRDVIIVDSNPASLLDRLASHHLPRVEQLISRDAT